MHWRSSCSLKMSSSDTLSSFISSISRLWNAFTSGGAKFPPSLKNLRAGGVQACSRQPCEGPAVPPEGAQLLPGSGLHLPQPELHRQPEAALAALGVFDVSVQTLQQGGAKVIQPARTRTDSRTSVSTVPTVAPAFQPRSNSCTRVPTVAPASRANTHNWLLLLLLREGSMFVTMATKSLSLLLMEVWSFVSFSLQEATTARSCWQRSSTHWWWSCSSAGEHRHPERERVRTASVWECVSMYERMCVCV